MIRDYRLCLFISPIQKKPQRFLVEALFYFLPGGVLLSHGESPHYHRRYSVSLLSSAWNQVGPLHYRRQDNSFDDSTFRYFIRVLFYLLVFVLRLYSLLLNSKQAVYCTFCFYTFSSFFNSSFVSLYTPSQNA